MTLPPFLRRRLDGAATLAARATLALTLFAGPAARAEGDPALAAIAPRPGGLTAAEVARRAASSSPEVRVRDAEILAAAAAVDQALTSLIPRASLTARYTRLSSVHATTLGEAFGPQLAGLLPGDSGSQPLFPVLLNNTLFQASLTVPLSSYLVQLSQAYAAAGRARDAAQINREATRLKVASDGRLLFYSWVRARGQVAIAEQGLAIAGAHLNDLKNMFAQGMVSQADVMRVDSQLAQADMLATRARGLAALLEEQLRITMHEAHPGPYEVGEDVATPVERPPTRTWDELYTEATRNRLELRALAATRGALEQQVKVARATAYPRVDAYGDVLSANPNQRIFPLVDKFFTTWDVGVQLTWSPNDIGNGVGGARAADAQRAQVLAREAQLRDGVRIELVQAEIAARDAAMGIETSTRGLRAAEESYRVRRELFKNGRATSVELSDAEADLTRARLESLSARIEARVAEVKLEHAIGRDSAPGPERR